MDNKYEKFYKRLMTNFSGCPEIYLNFEDLVNYAKECKINVDEFTQRAIWSQIYWTFKKQQDYKIKTKYEFDIVDGDREITLELTLTGVAADDDKKTIEFLFDKEEY